VAEIGREREREKLRKAKMKGQEEGGGEGERGGGEGERGGAKAGCVPEGPFLFECLID